MGKQQTYMKWGFACSFIIVISAYYIGHFAITREPVEGIFEIKLGMTEAELKQVVDTTYLKTEKKWRQYESIDWKGFELDKYKVNQFHEIERIGLEFLDDSLYSIRIKTYNKKTERWLTEKYGGSENTRTSSRLETKTRYKSWSVNGQDTKCNSEYDIDYSGDEARITYFLQLYNKEKKTFVDKVWKTYNKQKSKEEKRS